MGQAHNISNSSAAASNNISDKKQTQPASEPDAMIMVDVKWYSLPPHPPQKEKHLMFYDF